MFELEVAGAWDILLPPFSNGVPASPSFRLSSVLIVSSCCRGVLGVVLALACCRWLWLSVCSGACSIAFVHLASVGVPGFILYTLPAPCEPMATAMICIRVLCLFP